MRNRKRHNKPGGSDMPLPANLLVVNGRSVPIFGYFNNSMTPDACRAYGLEVVDIDIVHTDLGFLGLDNAPPDTYGFVYCLPKQLDLGIPISTSVGIRLGHLDQRTTEVEAVTYDGNKYERQLSYRFSLAGTMGCTAAMHLSFFLLDRQGYKSQQLGLLFIFDEAKLQERHRFELPVADDPIMKFCMEQSSPLMATKGGQSDCNKWRLCKNQQGQKCDPEWAKCR